MPNFIIAIVIIFLIIKVYEKFPPDDFIDIVFFFLIIAVAYGCIFKLEVTMQILLRIIGLVLGVFIPFILFPIFFFGFLKRLFGNNKNIKQSKAKQPKPIHPTQLYHGTKLDNANEIYNTGLFLVGQSKPRAVWMTDNFEIAQTYSGEKGGIVIIKVDSCVELTNECSGVYIYKIPTAKPKKEYYRIPGLTPVGILDYHGTKLT